MVSAPPPADALALPGVPRFGPAEVVAMALRNLAASSREAYSKDYEAFAKWMAVDQVTAVGRLLGLGRPAANALVTDWLGEMREQGLSSSSRARRLSALKALVRAGRRLGVVEWALDVKAPPVENFDARGPTQEQALKLLTFCEEATLEGLRNRALLLVALTLGLRSGEIAAMRRSDFCEGKLRVLGKRRKITWFIPGVETLAAIEKWISAWIAEHPEDAASDLVFRSLAVSRYGMALSPKSVWDIITALGQRGGVRIRPIGLRHTAITTALDLTGGDLRAVQSFGRHDDPKVTVRYDDNRQDFAAEVTRRLDELFGKP